MFLQKVKEFQLAATPLTIRTNLESIMIRATGQGFPLPFFTKYISQNSVQQSSANTRNTCTF